MDGTKVDKLNKSNEAFVLHMYKAECGKPYRGFPSFCALKLTLLKQL